MPFANASRNFVMSLLAVREQRLVGELAQCRTDGQRYLDECFATLRALIATDSGKAKSIAKASFVSRMEKFNANKTDDLEVALTARFLYDKNASSAISVAISQLGTVPAVSAVEPTPPAAVITQNGDNHNIKNNNNNNKCFSEPSSNKTVVAAAAAAVSTNAAPPHPPPARNENVVKRSNSPSSLVSSVGEDSGLGGQISPVDHVEKSQPVQVEENGIVLKSDTVSADQLAEIQRQIAETLKAKGIDPSVLGASFGTATTVAPHRRPPPANAGAKNGPSAAARDKDGTKATTAAVDGQRKQQQKQPNAMNNNNGGEKRK